jgi:hypothetical protein
MFFVPSVAQYTMSSLDTAAILTLSEGMPVKNITVPLPLAVALVLITGAIVAITTKPDHLFAQAGSSYVEDRAAIEDLQARYLFAPDFHDPDLYVSTFTEDGVLDYGSGDVKAARRSKT